MCDLDRFCKIWSHINYFWSITLDHVTCQESWSSGKKSGQCVVAGTGHGVIPKYVFVCLAPLQPDEYYM